MDSDAMLEEREQRAFVEELIRTEVLEGPALGVAKQFAANGWAGLSEKQRRVVETHVLDAHMVKACDHCGNSIPWSEQAAALDNGGLCSYCEHRWDKVMNEE